MISGCSREQEPPVHLHPGVGPGGLGEVVGEGAQGLVVEGAANLGGAAQHLPHEGPLAVQSVADEGRRDHHLVAEPPDLREHHPRADPGRKDVQRQVLAEALRRPQAEQVADPAAPVVADQLHPVEALGVEHRQHVVGQVLLLVALARRVAPAEAALVDRDRPVTGRRQPRQQVAPLVPVLRPAVQAEDDVVALPRFGQMEAQPARLDPAMADAVYLPAAPPRRRASARVGARSLARRPWSPCGGSPRAARPSPRGCRRPFPARPCPGDPGSSSGRCR